MEEKNEEKVEEQPKKKKFRVFGDPSCSIEW
mgnify:CR=1 FL=1